MRIEAHRYLVRVLSPLYFGERASELDPPPQVASGVFWNEFFRQARASEVEFPALTTIAHTSWASTLPQKYKLELEIGLARLHLLRAANESELETVVSLLSQEKMRAVLSGAEATLLRCYPKNHYRDVSSIDLIVSQINFRSLLRTFGKAGYRMKKGDARLGWALLSRKKMGPQVKVVTSFLSEALEDETDSVFEKAHPIKSFGSCLYQLDDLSYMVNLIQTAADRGIDSPVLLSDLHFFLQQSEQFNWYQATVQLKEEKRLTAAWLILKMLKEYWHTGVSNDSIERIEKQMGRFRIRLVSSAIDPQIWFLKQWKSKHSGWFRRWAVAGSPIRQLQARRVSI